MMYQIGDLIIYGSNGGKIYTPIDTDVFMRPVITYEEVQQLISHIPAIRAGRCNNYNVKMLQDYYQMILQTHACEDLLKLIKTIYTKKIIVVDLGKKLGQIDERYMKKAEDLLYSEFAIALSIPKESVKGYIEDKVKELENANNM